MTRKTQSPVGSPNSRASERKVATFIYSVLTLALLVALSGCGTDQCSSHIGNKVECGGSMDDGSYYWVEYDEYTGWFHGALWCGGPPTGGEPPDYTCTGTRGATPQGDTVRCLDINGNPFDPSTIVPGTTISCS